MCFHGRDGDRCISNTTSTCEINRQRISVEESRWSPADNVHKAPKRRPRWMFWLKTWFQGDLDWHLDDTTQPAPPSKMWWVVNYNDNYTSYRWMIDFDESINWQPSNLYKCWHQYGKLFTSYLIKKADFRLVRCFYSLAWGYTFQEYFSGTDSTLCYFFPFKWLFVLLSNLFLHQPIRYQCFDRTFSPLIELFRVSFVLNTVGFCRRCTMSPCGYRSQNRKLFPLMQTCHKWRASYCRYFRCKIAAISHSCVKDSSCEWAIGVFVTPLNSKLFDVNLCRPPFSANQHCLFTLWGVQMHLFPTRSKVSLIAQQQLIFPR